MRKVWSNLKIVQIWGDGDAYAGHMSDRMSGADGQKPNRIRHYGVEKNRMKRIQDDVHALCNSRKKGYRSEIPWCMLL